MRGSLGTALLCLTFVSCADNANSFVDRLGEAASRLSSSESSASLTVPFDPTNGATSPYTLIFFPDRDVTEAELVAAGVDEPIARRIYSEMNYLGNMAGKVVVDQERERLQFTSSWKRFANVQPPATLVVSQRKTGTSEIELRRDDGAIRVVAIR